MITRELLLSIPPVIDQFETVDRFQFCVALDLNLMEYANLEIALEKADVVIVDGNNLYLTDKGRKLAGEIQRAYNL